MTPAQQKRTLSEAHVDDDDAYCSASADSDEDRQTRRRPRKRVKASTATNPMRRKTVDLKSIRIPVCYHSEKNNLFTKAWWQEVTQRDSFWEEFRTKVNAGTIRRRFNVSVNIGFDKIDPSSSVNQQKRVQTGGCGSSAVSTTAPKTPLRGIDGQTSAAATCDGCGSALSAEHECASCRLDQAVMDDSEGDGQTKERETKNIVINIPRREPQRRFGTPESFGDTTERTPSEAIPEAHAAEASGNGRGVKLVARSVTAGAQSVSSVESDSKCLDADDANMMENDKIPSTMKLRPGRKVVQDPAVIDDDFKTTDVKQDDILDAKVELEVPRYDEPKLRFDTRTRLTDTKFTKQTSPDLVAVKQQAKVDDIADAKLPLASPTDVETKIGDIKVEEDNAESLRRPTVDADWVQVRHGGADHIVASSQLIHGTYNGKPVFIFKNKGNMAIVPVADVTPLSEPLSAQAEDDVKVKIEEGSDSERGARKGVKCGQPRTLIEIEDD